MGQICILGNKWQTCTLKPELARFWAWGGDVQEEGTIAQSEIQVFQEPHWLQSDFLSCLSVGLQLDLYTY